MVGWLALWLAGWLAGWLVGWLRGWFARWLQIFLVLLTGFELRVIIGYRVRRRSTTDWVIFTHVTRKLFLV